MSRLFNILGAAAAVVAVTAGCCMVEKMKLEEQQAPEIKTIVDSHRKNVNCKKELDILCGKAWVPVYVEGQMSKDGKENISMPDKAKQPYIEFSRDGEVCGFAGVNNFYGEFAVTSPNGLRFGRNGVQKGHYVFFVRNGNVKAFQIRIAQQNVGQFVDGWDFEVDIFGIDVLGLELLVEEVL